MASFRKKLIKNIAESLHPYLSPTVISTSSQPDPKPSGFYLTRSITRKIRYLANLHDTPAEQIFLNALEIGLAQQVADSQSIRKWHTLTPKEQEVAALICLGLANDEIATELSIAIGTVKAHVSHILHKLAAENRTHLQEQLRWWHVEDWLSQSH